jgi:hypothetical protein
MPTLTLEIPAQTFAHLAMPPDELAATMQRMAALKMYELGTLSSQEAAALAHVSRQVFLQLLRRYQIPPFERLDENGAPIAAVETLSDTDVVRLAHMQMPAWQSRRLHELLEQQQNTPLAPVEGEELTALLRMHDRALLLKSEAMVEAVRRGLCTAGTSA